MEQKTEKEKKPKKLTTKQQLFVMEFLKDLNQTQAAIRAGYSENSASVVAVKLMRMEHVKAAIQWAMNGRAERIKLEADDVLQEIAIGAFYDIGEIAKHPLTSHTQIATLPEALRKCIVGWKYDKWGNLELRFASKTQHLELLGKHLKLFNQTIELKTPEVAKPMSPAEAMEHLKNQLEAESATDDNGA